MPGEENPFTVSWGNSFKPGKTSRAERDFEGAKKSSRGGGAGRPGEENESKPGEKEFKPRTKEFTSGGAAFRGGDQELEGEGR